MCWYVIGNRRTLLNIFGRSTLNGFATNMRCGKNELFTQKLNKDEIKIIWNEDPTKSSPIFPYPNLIVISDDSINEFLAWCITYIGTLSPCTSFIRVLGETTYNQFISIQTPSDSLIHYPANFIKSLVGVIIGESITGLFNNEIKKINPLSINSCSSFPFVRALLHNVPHTVLSKYQQNWNKVTALLKQSPKVLKFEKIQTVLNTIVRAYDLKMDLSANYRDNSDYILQEALRDYILDSKVRKDFLMSFNSRIQFFQDVSQIDLNGPRDKIIHFLNSAINYATRSEVNKDNELISFYLAYLTSQIDHGAFAYTELLKNLLPKYDTIYLWYGVFTAIHPQSELEQYDNGLGIRIIRDLIRPMDIHNRPECDIAWEELAILGLSKEPLLRTEGASHLRVEILPAIEAVFQFPIKVEQKEISTQNGKQMSMFGSSDSNEEIKTILKEITEHANKISFLANKQLSPPTSKDSTNYIKSFPKKKSKNAKGRSDNNWKT